MPGNIITINNSNFLRWYVGDSQMEDLIKWLNKHGSKREEKNEISEEGV